MAFDICGDCLGKKKEKEKEENQIRGLEKSWMMMEYNKRFASLPLRLPNLIFFFLVLIQHSSLKKGGKKMLH